MSSSKPSIRDATEADIPAMLSLLLTSFRQFSLFSFLYSPLHINKDATFDTSWVWRRRLLLGLLDPKVSIIVAEVDDGVTAPLVKTGGTDGEIIGESWKMLEWIETRAALNQRSPAEKGKMIVGFAIWKARAGEKVGKSVSEEEMTPWMTKLRTTAIKTEIWFWSQVWTRRDQDLAAYAVYLEAEEELSEKYYADTCYYLDNACVDFRYQRLGIGSALVKRGLVNAHDKGLPAMTEAGPMGLGMYLKLGFQQVGTWRVPTKDGEEEFMDFPVLRLEVSANT